MSQVGRPTVGVVVTAHQRPHDARINIELIRALWEPVLGPVQIVHTNNGNRDWYPQAGMEDRLIRMTNGPSHGQSAGNLIDRGMQLLHTGFGKIKPVDYAVHLEADTWLTNAEWLGELVHELEATQRPVAASTWGLDPESSSLRRQGPVQGAITNEGLATDFFVVNVKWAFRTGFLPIAYNRFTPRYRDLLSYAQDVTSFEAHFAGKLVGAAKEELLAYQRAVRRGEIPDDEIEAPMMKDADTSQPLRHANELLRYLRERPIDNKDPGVQSCKATWPDIGLINDEDPATRQEFLRGLPDNVIAQCPTAAEFVAATDLSYYNAHSYYRPDLFPLS